MTGPRDISETGIAAEAAQQEPAFDLNIEHLSADHVVIHLHGTISSQGAERLDRTLNFVMAAEKAVITVDVSDSQLGDRSSITVLRGAHHAQRTSGRRLHITGAKGPLLTELMLAGIS